MAYGASYFQEPKTQKQGWVFRRYLEFLKNIGVDLKSKRLCDIGCGTGGFLSLVSNLEGCEAWGVDCSPYAIEVCRREDVCSPERLLVHDIGQEALAPGYRFDVITMFDVIEHLANLDPLRQSLHRNLEPGGYLALTTPNAFCWDRLIFGRRYYAETDPTHQMLYSPYTLDFALRRMGMQLVSMSTPYPFWWRHDILTRSLKWGGQIFAVYRKPLV
jgi:2-polyprenyl-3-methyl-5-hydroxy-6-metoxy-1,4-benzoquinol methylase